MPAPTRLIRNKKQTIRLTKLFRKLSRQSYIASARNFPQKVKNYTDKMQ